MRLILFLAAFMLLLGGISSAQAGDTLAGSAAINSCSDCGKCNDSKCGCEKPSCGCKEKKCGREKPNCGCKQKCSCEKQCGCEKRDCGCISNEIMYGDGLAFSLSGADSLQTAGLAFSMVDVTSSPLDPGCCPSEKFCLIDNCTECYTLACCSGELELLCNDRCGKQKCGSCNRCEHKCGCEKPKCGCEKPKCGCKAKSSCGCQKKSCGCGKCASH